MCCVSHCRPYTCKLHVQRCVSQQICVQYFSVLEMNIFFKLLKKANFDICFTDAPFVKFSINMFSMCMYSVCHELIRNKAMTLVYTRNMHVAFRFQAIIKLFSERLIFDKKSKHFEIKQFYPTTGI